MKNTIKMSLAAAVAVSAFSTSAFAGNLEEMIKGVDVSGYVDYRLEDKSIDDKTATNNDRSANWNEYSINVTVNSKVNDIVSATVSAGFDEIITANSEDDALVGTGNGTVNSIVTETANGDTTAPVSVDQAYFTFAMGNTTVMAGKQNIPSVFVDQTDTVKQGAGIVAVQRISDAITLAGAHFMNNNIVSDTTTTELIAMGNISMFNYAVNYNMTDIAAPSVVNANGEGIESKRYSINLGAKVAGFTFDLRHTVSSTDDQGTAKFEDAEVTKFSVGTSVAGIKLGALYAVTNAQKGTADGLTAENSNVAIDGDNDAKVHAKIWQLSTSGLNDGEVIAVTADAPIMDKVTAGIAYAVAEGTNYDNAAKTSDREASELLLKLTYKMSKNFTIHGRYSILQDETKNTAGVKTADYSSDYSRIQVKYTF
jgi:hypothetical protein